MLPSSAGKRSLSLFTATREAHLLCRSDESSVHGCYEPSGTQLVFAGPFAAGTDIAAEMVAPLLASPPRLQVTGAYPEWTLTYEDGADADFNDMILTLTALPTGN